MFKFDPDFLEHEARYKEFKDEILGSDDEDGDSDGSDDDESDEEGGGKRYIFINFDVNSDRDLS